MSATFMCALARLLLHLLHMLVRCNEEVPAEVTFFLHKGEEERNAKGSIEDGRHAAAHRIRSHVTVTDGGVHTEVLALLKERM